MNETGRARVSSVLTWIFSIATVLVAALLIVQCAGIYFEGTSPENLTEIGVYIHSIYSREIVAERFSEIASAVWIWLALLVAALFTRTPAQKEALKAPAQNQLSLLKKRAEMTDTMRAEENKRKKAGLICVAVCVVCAAAVLLYMTDLTHFKSRDLEPVVGTMLIHVVPWVAAAFACMMVFEQLRYKSILREIEEAKKAPKKQPEPEKEKDPKGRNLARAVLYAAAVVLLVMGVMNGGMRDVLVKAVNICTECIGLG